MIRRGVSTAVPALCWPSAHTVILPTQLELDARGPGSVGPSLWLLAAASGAEPDAPLRGWDNRGLDDATVTQARLA